MDEDEYFALEARSPFKKHEFFNGYVVAMAGVLPVHVTIAAQISCALNNRLNSTTSQAGGNDLKVRIAEEKINCFPDVVVWCQNARFDPVRKGVLLSPIVIFEVLSPSTQRTDRGIKLGAYLQIPELQDYLIVASEMVFIEHYSRINADDWRFRRYTNREQIISFAALNLEISVAEVYHKSEVPEGALQLELDWDEDEV